MIDAQGSRGEASLFGKPSRWVDYAGPVAPGKIEGICVMDHPSNPGHPVRWHVRGDGWLGPSFNRESPYGVTKDHALGLRYRLLIHAGRPDQAALDQAWEVFAATPAYQIVRPHGGEIASLAPECELDVTCLRSRRRAFPPGSKEPLLNLILRPAQRGIAATSRSGDRAPSYSCPDR